MPSRKMPQESAGDPPYAFHLGRLFGGILVRAAAGPKGAVRCASLPRRKDFRARDSLPFGHVVKLIYLQIFQRVHLAAGPVNFEQLYALRRPDSEVNAQVVLREIPSSTADFVDLRM